MFIAGIWHGAGWTFVLWGALHGAYLVINHGWRHLTGSTGHCGGIAATASWMLTFIVVVAGWVLFRAESLLGAVSLLQSMMGWHGIALPSASHLGSFATVLPQAIFTGSLEPSLIIGLGRWVRAAVWIAALLPATLLLPNAQEFMGLHQPKEAHRPRLHWKPNSWYAFAFVVLIIVSVSTVLLAEQRDFLYFQF